MNPHVRNEAGHVRSLDAGSPGDSHDCCAVRRFSVSPVLEGRRTMSVGRRWVRRLALLLAAGMVVQVPALVGVRVSGASAATGTYQATLSIDSHCVATVTATYTNPKPQSLQLSVNDLTTSQTNGPANKPVSGNPGTVSESFQMQLNLLPLGATNHNFNAVVWFYTGSSSYQRYTNSVNAPCYWGRMV
jgi:hypothetical protein